MHVRITTLAALVLAAAVPAACTAPRIAEGRFACEGDSDCPGGFTCQDDGYCYTASATGGGVGGGVGGGTGGGTADGGVDGGPNCAPLGDYVEALVDANDSAVGGTPETTGLTLTSGWQTIAGCIEPSTGSTPNKTDQDEFTFTVPSGASAWLDVHVQRDPAQATTFVVEIPISESTSIELLASTKTDTYPAPVVFGPGEHTLVVRDIGDVPFGAAPSPYGYAISLRRFTCGTTNIVHDAEDETTSSRTNDVFSLSYTIPPVTLTLTSAVDAPQVTGLTAGATPKRFVGTLADFATEGDAYIDRDAYEISTGANVHALVFQLELAYPALVDTVVVDAVDVSLTGIRGIELALGADFTLKDVSAVAEPNHQYLFWFGRVDTAGVAESALNYVVTFCALDDQ